MDLLSRSGLVVIMLLGLLLPARVSGQEASIKKDGARLVETYAGGLVFEIDVPLPKIEEVQVDGQVFQRLSLPGYLPDGKPGQPELLQTGVMLGIPLEGQVEVRILDATIEELPGVYTVYPSPEHVVQRDADSGAADPLAGVQERFTWDTAAYSVDQYQPATAVLVDDTAFMRGQRVARVLIQPVQFNPAQGSLRVYRNLQVEVTFPGAPASTSHAANTAPELFDPILKDQMLNFDQALAWRSERGQPQDSGRSLDTIYPGDTSRAWFKTHLSRSGLVKVTVAELQGADLAPLAAANPAYLQVWTQGQQVAAHFVGDNDAQFEAGEALLFYAHVEPTIYSETDVYWLSVGDTPGLRMSTSDATPAGAVTDMTAWATMRFEEDHIFGSNLPPYPVVAQYPRWYWAELINGIQPEFTVNAMLPNAVTNGYTAALRVRIQGVSQFPAINPDHRVQVEVNGQVVGAVTWDGVNTALQEFEVPATWLQSGLNAVTLSVQPLPGVTTDRSYIDWVEVDYRHTLMTDVNNQASFVAAGGGRQEFQVQGFSSPEVLAFDVTDPAAPLRLTGVQVQAAAMSTQPLHTLAARRQVTAVSSSHQVYLPIVQSRATASTLGYSARFGATSVTQRAYALALAASTPSIATLTLDAGSALHSLANRADYLLITHRDLWSAAETLANHRRSRGLAVALIDVQDVYDEWSNGRMDPLALRNFVAFAYGNWQAPAPAYLMLLGSGHYDYRLRTGLTTQPVLVPTYFACVDPWSCEVAVENEFVTVSGSDRLPDLAIGRLPARTLAEATVMVNKTLAYETSPPSGSWAGTLAFVADNARDANGVPDPAGNFEALSEGIIALTPPQYTVKRVFYDPYPDDDSGEPYRYRTPTATTDAIVAAVNGGAVFLNYIGHASNTTWAHEALLRARDVGRNDVTRFTNGPRQPIVLDMACVSGNFADPTVTGIEVMMLGWPSGGSVAGWGATGFGVATGHDQLHRGFYLAVYNSGVRTLGLATAAGKQALWNSGRNLDLMDTFDLLGDPALRINLQPTTD